MLRAIVDKLLVGIGTAIATAIIIYFSSWNTNQVPVVDASWIEVPLTTVDLSVSDRIKLQGAALDKAFRVDILPQIVEDLRYQSSFVIFTVKIANRSDEVLKQIEASARDQVASLAYGVAGSDKTVLVGRTGPVLIPPLNPGESRQVVFITKRFFSEFPIRVIHDGKLVKVRPLTAEDNFIGITSYFLGRPFLLFLLILGAALGIFMFALLIVSWLIQNKFEFLVRVNSRNELARIVRFADYVRQKHRHELPDALKDQPTLAAPAGDTTKA